ncbi:hypothetical protein RB653_006129 [Dictyostelium firmibasis]|uniref:Uncharacterized protein n=1 Tax=Dictyostelium firmibasis TaxID=79012 RepID=A0AAN7U8W1_9MYCE
MVKSQRLNQHLWHFHRLLEYNHWHHLHSNKSFVVVHNQHLCIDQALLHDYLYLNNYHRQNQRPYQR